MLLYFAILIIIIIKAVVFARIEQRIVHLKVRKARRTPPLTHYPIPHLPQITTHRDVKHPPLTIYRYITLSPQNARQGLCISYPVGNLVAGAFFVRSLVFTTEP
jgi:hypothetical protein